MVATMKARLFTWIFLIGMMALAGCLMRDIRWSSVRPPPGVSPKMYRVVTTGYCPCRSCCGWKRNWYGKPVIAYGPLRGERKAVGITASGAEARHGTIAADTSIFPFGTIIHVPGYGYGVVEDRGGDIKGYHIDLYFSSHQTAREWGREIKDVKVWFPRKK
jgi:3D (Asp-Asp-Asp) domain-containing protein